MAGNRASPRRPHQGGDGRAAAAERLLHGGRQRRRVEIDGLRPHLDADLRRPADRIGRRDRRRPSNPNIIYVGSGEGLQRPDLSTGDGIYKSTDAGQDLDAPRPARRPADPADHRRPEQPRSAVRRRARPPLRAERGARRLPLDRRRPHVPEGPLQGRGHRRGRRRVRPVERRITSTPCCGQARQGPWENGAFSGPGSGLFKSDRRRQHVAAADEGPADLRTRDSAASASPSRRAIRSGCTPPCEARRTAGSTDRTTRGESWHARQRETARRRRRAATTSPRSRSHPKNPDIVFTCEHRDVEVHRRRQDVHGAARRARRRRLPPHLDQPEQPDIMLMRRRPGRDRHGQRRRRRGAAGTTSRRRSSTTSAPTTRSRTGSAAASRRAARRASQSRGDDGQITFRDWHPVGVEEYGYVAPDPLDPDIVYGGKVIALRPAHRPGADMSRRRRAQGRPYRVVRTPPCSSRRSIRTRCTSPSNTLWKTTSGGPGLDADQPRSHARRRGTVPANVGKLQGTRRRRGRRSAA